jgi:hypothetical protein
MLIGAGDYGAITPLYLAAEGEMITKIPNTNLIDGLVVLIASYYVFNVSYPTRGRNFFAFVEATLLDNNEDAKKRVSTNKILKELDM